MIRINLLGTPKAKVRRMPKITMSGAVIADAVDLGRPQSCLARLRSCIGALKTSTKRSKSIFATPTSKLAALAGVKGGRIRRNQKEVDAIKHKFTVIDQLRANQNGPVQLLNTITQTVNSTDAVWLNKMSDDGKSISMDGMALSTTAVANLITNLKQVGYFKEHRTEGDVAGRFGKRVPGVHLHAGV